MLAEAGCKKQIWEGGQGKPLRYKWQASGYILNIGVCILDNYQKFVPPLVGTTKVYNTIETQKVRGINAKKKTLTIDFTLTMRWMDSRIKTNLLKNDQNHGKILLDPEAIKKIWTPDLYIWNRQSFKAKEEWASLVTASILTAKDIHHLDGKNDTEYDRSIPTVEMKYEIKTTVFCENWHYTNYPMDEQACDVTFGSASGNSIFSLQNEIDLQGRPKYYTAINFNINTKFFEKTYGDGGRRVGIRIVMDRIATSFLFKYYAPCIAIVLVSEIGFLIPLSAIPGRVALLVTQFLTLVNLFIHQMVSVFGNQIS